MTTTNDPSIIHYMKCKTKTETTNLEQVTLKNGWPAGKGLCAVCGTRKFRMGAGKA